MLGKSVGAWMLVVALCALTACPYNVKQDKASGEDSKSTGAVELVLENGEAKTSGIVTYPGGDRADWKVIELPEKKVGKMDIKLSWTPPRPGLQLGFDVFDEWGGTVFTDEGKGKKKKKKRGARRSVSAEVESAKGKYYIRVYAKERGDAGKYRLTVEWAETVIVPDMGFESVEVADPPRLPDLPEIVVACVAHDINNPSCATVCAPGAPPEHPPCAGKCNLQAVDPELPDCREKAPCPNPPDINFKKCRPIERFWKACDPAKIDPDNPRCCGVNKAGVVGRVISTSVVGGVTTIIVGVGSDQGIEDSYDAEVLQGNAGKNSDPPLSGGKVTIVSIDKKSVKGTVTLTPDQVNSNKRVRFNAPKTSPACKK